MTAREDPAYGVMVRLRERGLAQMNATGQWELSREGREYIEELRALYFLAVHRPGANLGSQPRRQAPRDRSAGAGSARGKGTTGG